MRFWILVTMSFFGLLTHNGMTLAQEAAVEVVTTTATAPTEKEQFINPIIERSSHAHVHVNPGFKGFWAKKFSWRPRWVKTWQEKKIYVAVWKRMWGPVVSKEWVPVPKPPPGWVKSDAGSYIVKQNPHH